jgi:hypothetical protein
MAALNSVAARRETSFHANSLQALRVTAPVFLLGHHRSGTTHLWNLLAVDEQFAVPTVLQAVFPHTFLSWEENLRGMAGVFAPRKRPQDNVAFSANAPIEDERAICTATQLSMQMARHFPRSRADFQPCLTLRDVGPVIRARWKAALDGFSRKLLLRYGAEKTLLLKSPDHTGKVRHILDLYPDARFIHIHRHPHEVFPSTRKMEITTQPLYAYQRMDLHDLDEFILWRYQTMMEAYAEDRCLIPSGRLAEVSFEELERRPLNALRNIYQTLSLGDFNQVRPAFERAVAGLSGYRKNRFPGLPVTTRNRLRSALMVSFDLYGYEP